MDWINMDFGAPMSLAFIPPMARTVVRILCRVRAENKARVPRERASCRRTKAAVRRNAVLALEGGTSFDTLIF